MAISATAALFYNARLKMFNGDLNLSNSYVSFLCTSVSGTPDYAISTSGSISGRVGPEKTIGAGAISITTSGTGHFVITTGWTFTATAGNISGKWCYVCQKSNDMPVFAFQISAVSVVATQITVQQPSGGFFEVSVNTA